MRWRLSARSFAAVALALFGGVTLGCGTDDAVPESDSGAPASASQPTEAVFEQDDRVFVLPATEQLALLDSQAATSEPPNDGPVLATFALDGSPDDEADGPRVVFGLADATGFPTDDVTSVGRKVAVGDRIFRWVSEGEHQRTYVGSSPKGATLALATLNVDEAAAVLLLADAEASGDGGVVFAGQVVPDGWVDTGSSTALQQFLAAATGSSTPIDGTRDLYGDPAAVSTPSWDDIAGGFGVTLSTWPVSGTDPESEARYHLEAEVEIEVRRGDGTSTTGFASPIDSEFFEYVVWQNAASWLALSRPVGDWREVLVDLVTTVREANPDEVEQLLSLRRE